MIYYVSIRAHVLDDKSSETDVFCDFGLSTNVNSWPSNQINKQYPNNLVLPRINKPVKYCIYTNYQLFLNWKVFLSVNGLVIESFHPIIISHG